MFLIKDAYIKIKNYIQLESNFHFLLISGGVGTGKTYISICAINEAMKNGNDVYYTSSYKLFEEMRKEKFNKIENDNKIPLLPEIYSFKFLVIDDLGSEKISEFVRCELLNLINTRKDTGFYTLINTNLQPDEIEKTYGSRISSRILGDGLTLEFVGEDLRIKKQLRCKAC